MFINHFSYSQGIVFEDVMKLVYQIGELILWSIPDFTPEVKQTFLTRLNEFRVIFDLDFFLFN